MTAPAVQAKGSAVQDLEMIVTPRKHLGVGIIRRGFAPLARVTEQESIASPLPPDIQSDRCAAPVEERINDNRLCGAARAQERGFCSRSKCLLLAPRAAV